MWFNYMNVYLRKGRKNPRKKMHAIQNMNGNKRPMPDYGTSAGALKKGKQQQPVKQEPLAVVQHQVVIDQGVQAGNKSDIVKVTIAHKDAEIKQITDSYEQMIAIKDADCKDMIAKKDAVIAEMMDSLKRQRAFISTELEFADRYYDSLEARHVKLQAAHDELHAKYNKAQTQVEMLKDTVRLNRLEQSFLP